MNIGLDIGYANVKVVSSRGKVQFPSLVGTGEKSAYSVADRQDMRIKVGDQMYNVGYTAVEQSRFAARFEERDWYTTPEYLALVYAAFASVMTNERPTLVTGLPVAFFESDKDNLKNLFESQTHLIQRENKAPLTIDVQRCVVIPQVMGTLLNEALNDDGQIADAEVAQGRIGVIDVGGNTTNLLHAYKMGDVARETTSIDLGGWDAMRAVRPVVEHLFPDAGYSDHEIANIIVNNGVKYKGEFIGFGQEIADAIAPMARQIVAKAMELWPGGAARLDKIFISGGGAQMIGHRIADQIEHGKIEIVEDSVFANAKGYYKLAQYHTLGG